MEPRVIDADVVVSGAGPAGTTAAYVAAKAGLRAILLEKHGPPRDKTCGGLLTRTCVDHVVRIFGRGVPEWVQIPPSPLPTIVVPPSGAAHSFRVPHEDVLNVTRRRFDGWLADLAADAGAHVLKDSETLAFRPEGDRVLVDARSATGAIRLRTRYLIGADGVYSAVRAQLAPRRPADRAYYIQEYVPRTGILEEGFYLLYRGAVSPIYAYAMPKGDELCLGLGVHKASAPGFHEGIARLKAWLTEDFGFRVSRTVRREGFGVPFGNVVFGHGHVLLAGDAAGLCYPPTGEGITFAIDSGAEASRAVIEEAKHPLERYAKRMEKVAEAIEAAAARTLSLTDEERERRIRSKTGI